MDNHNVAAEQHQGRDPCVSVLIKKSLLHSLLGTRNRNQTLTQSLTLCHNFFFHIFHTATVWPRGQLNVRQVSTWTMQAFEGIGPWLFPSIRSVSLFSEPGAGFISDSWSPVRSLNFLRDEQPPWHQPPVSRWIFNPRSHPWPMCEGGVRHVTPPCHWHCFDNTPGHW